MNEELRPKQPVRRFDVFAEYSRLKAMEEGQPPDQAKGYGLWLAKVVASRRYAPAGTRKEGGDEKERRAEAPTRGEHEGFRSLGGELQTDDLFDREIVRRMGEEFYREVFAPTIARHFEKGDRYESIRDTVRREWKPA